MTDAFWMAEKSRKICKRIVIEGELVLETPAHLGSGEVGDLTDMPLLVAPDDGKTPLLTGASIAGAMRSYLRAREFGWNKSMPSMNNSIDLTRERNSASVRLFGGFRTDDDGDQSDLIVEDSYCESSFTPKEIRSGVRILADSRTAKDNFLYNAEYWSAGLRFPLRMELLFRKDVPEAELRRALASALEGFENGEIGLGARRRRGFGKCRVSQWHVAEYDLLQPNGLLGWLEQDISGKKSGEKISELLGVKETIPDQRRKFTIGAFLVVEDTLMIRSSTGQADSADLVHLHSYRPEIGSIQVVSGSSLAGALRARARRIALTLQLKQAEEWVDQLFGQQDLEDGKKTPQASRIWVEESIVQGAQTMDEELVQNRVKINRFTGGAFETALFNEQPVFQTGNTRLCLKIQLMDPEDAQIGIVLLLLKDLWLGDLPLGGESGIGRGRLKGESATLELVQITNSKIWKFSQTTDRNLKFTEGSPEELEYYISTLINLREVNHE